MLSKPAHSIKFPDFGSVRRGWGSQSEVHQNMANDGGFKKKKKKISVRRKFCVILHFKYVWNVKQNQETNCR